MQRSSRSAPEEPDQGDRSRRKTLEIGRGNQSRKVPDHGVKLRGVELANKTGPLAAVVRLTGKSSSGPQLNAISFGGTGADTITRTRDADVQIIKGYIPGSIGRVAELHATYYQHHWGFDLFFEAKVATELAAFLGRYDEQRDGFWIAVVGAGIEGSITIDGSHAAAEGAHLRWFVMSDALRGKGVGNQLMDVAIGFCRSRGYRRMYLWTFEGLDVARHLYEKSGFRLVEQKQGTQWGREVNEQRFELQLG